VYGAKGIFETGKQSFKKNKPNYLSKHIYI
jgi:hypothetical protein